MAARIAGGALLTIIVSGVVGTLIGREQIVMPGDAATTVREIAAHATRFRVGSLLEIVMLNGDVVLALALYRLLEPVDAALALLGTFWRLVNAIVLAGAVVASLVVADIVSDARVVAAFPGDQVAVLATLLLNLHGTGSLVGLISFCCGAAVHAYLLLESRYIPRWLAGAYLLVAVQLLICCVGFVVVPDAMKPVETLAIAPDFIVELVVALWLSFRGARIEPFAAERLTGRAAP